MIRKLALIRGESLVKCSPVNWRRIFRAESPVLLDKILVYPKICWVSNCFAFSLWFRTFVFVMILHILILACAVLLLIFGLRFWLGRDQSGSKPTSLLIFVPSVYFGFKVLLLMLYSRKLTIPVPSVPCTTRGRRYQRTASLEMRHSRLPSRRKHWQPWRLARIDTSMLQLSPPLIARERRTGGPAWITWPKRCSLGHTDLRTISIIPDIGNTKFMLYNIIGHYLT